MGSELGYLVTSQIAKSTAPSGRLSKVSNKDGTTKRLTEFSKCGCGVNQSKDLPPLCHKLARNKKTNGTAYNFLQNAVETTSNALGIQQVSKVTVQHATALTGWMFYGAGNQSLGEGLVPFSVVPTNQVSNTTITANQQAHHQNMDYNTVMTGTTSITSKDAQKLRSSKGYIKANFNEMVV